MKIPVIRGLIDRRIMVNYRVDPAILAKLLPAPFRPQVFRGSAFVGICLIRLMQIRPRFMPAFCGISSENAAHRTAVEWDDQGTTKTGVYVRRRDTNSWLNSLAGGRVFPGVHHHARFDVHETDSTLSVGLRSDDGDTSMLVRCHRSDKLSATSRFSSITEASEFFQMGALGYSEGNVSGRYQGLELKCLNWEVQPLDVDEVHSSFFDDEALFPNGSIEFDCALLMRGIEHEWHSRPDLCGPCV